MTTKPKVIDDGASVTVRAPISIRQRGGRKLVLAPGGNELAAVLIRRRVDSALIKAIARAFRWRDMLENGTHLTIAEIATAERINPSYVSRVLRLTFLAPDLVEAVLDGRQAADITLAWLLKEVPGVWDNQIPLSGT